MASSVGLDPFAMLRQAEIVPDSLSDPELRLPASSVIQLIEESARKSGCQCFGMLLAERRTYESLGPIVSILEREGSLRAVIDTTIRLRRSFNDVVGLNLTEHAETTVIEVLMLPEFAGEQAVSLLAAMAYVLLRGASRGTWNPQVVHLRQNVPTDTSAFDRFYPSPVRFKSTVNGFECDPSSLDRSWQPVTLSSEVATLIESLERQICELRQRALSRDDELLGELEKALTQIRSMTSLLR